MCDLDSENGPTTSRDEWRNARKSHVCCACGETIRVGDRYHVFWGIWDGMPEQFKHCARCWTILESLPEGAQLDLGCGVVWKDPPEHIAALAFALPGEIGEVSLLPWTPEESAALPWRGEW